MNSWPHKHILTLANFSKEDYAIVLEFAERFNSLNNAGTKKIPALQGYLITSIFFEASTRTKNSFELAAKRLSADVQSFSPSSSSMAKGETHIDTALTYAAMGSDILIVRHSSSHIPYEIAKKLDKKGYTTSVLNGGDGLHSHPSQGLLDLYTLSKFFSPNSPDAKILDSKNILIVGDVLHSRVARSNIWALTSFGANVVLCGPETLIPDEFKSFINQTNFNEFQDPIKKRGKITISRRLNSSIKDADAVIILRLQKERMVDNLLSSLRSYSSEFCLTPEKLELNKKDIPILHPGPINRGIEISSRVVDEYQNCLINNQVSNSIPVRMALLYLLSKSDKEIKVI
ncbi:MAG: aspartate carbamoyltransferase [Prochlorococcus sp. SP3034]|nr:aspartate carbamoyltransferase [Prochlorococcus sp. SP3034]|tara:strand:- start:1316 stop:2347 length:1032 start_codon:yes stop_codon:yes gene_type:complete